MVELSSGGRQPLLVTAGMHGEAAVTAAPVMAVRREAEGVTNKNLKVHSNCSFLLSK